VSALPGAAQCVRDCEWLEPARGKQRFFSAPKSTRIQSRSWISPLIGRRSPDRAAGLLVAHPLEGAPPYSRTTMRSPAEEGARFAPGTAASLGSDHGKYLPPRDFLENLTCFSALERQCRYRNHCSKRQAVHASASAFCLEQKWSHKLRQSDKRNLCPQG